MNWNEFRTDYVKRHGTTSIQELSNNYGKYKKSATRKYKIQQSEKVMKNKNSPTRGWAAMSPQRGTERHLLKEKCGNKAFLIPDEEKFPVMPALRVSDDCEYSCQGINSAIVRACQYNYLDVAEKAQKLGEQHCAFRKKSPCRVKGKAPGPPM